MISNDCSSRHHLVVDLEIKKESPAHRWMVSTARSNKFEFARRLHSGQHTLNRSLMAQPSPRSSWTSSQYCAASLVPLAAGFLGLKPLKLSCKTAVSAVETNDVVHFGHRFRPCIGTAALPSGLSAPLLSSASSFPPRWSIEELDAS